MLRMRARTRSPVPPASSGGCVLLPFEGVTVSTQTDETSIDALLMYSSTGLEGERILSARSSGYFPELRMSQSASPRASPTPPTSVMARRSSARGGPSPSRLTSTHTTASRMEVYDQFDLRSLSAPPMDSNLSSRKASDQSSVADLSEDVPATMAQERRRRSSDGGKHGNFKLRMLEVLGLVSACFWYSHISCRINSKHCGGHIGPRCRRRSRSVRCRTRQRESSSSRASTCRHWSRSSPSYVRMCGYVCRLVVVLKHLTC
jgi:hypothetical protein